MPYIVRRGFPLGLSCSIAFACALAFAVPGATATFTVSTLADSGLGSLRQAVLDANAAAGPDQVVFAPGLSGVITLSSGQIAITDDLTVTGPGAGVLTVSGNDQSRIFEIDDGTSAVIGVTLSGLTLTRGHTVGYGGAIRATEDLTITGSRISDSSASSDLATQTVGLGGNVAFLSPYDEPLSRTLRIADSTLTQGHAEGLGWGTGGNLYASSGRVTLERSEISDGVSEWGGGIAIGGGSLEIRSSTVSSNSTHAAIGGDGGGIKAFDTEVEIVNSTISGNTSSGYGGGISFETSFAPGFADRGWNGPTLRLRMTTVANNTAAVDSGNLSAASTIYNEPQIDHSIIASGTPGTLIGLTASYSLIEDQGIVHGAHNIRGVDPLLGPLADNGGPTRTHALLPGSPVIDAGDPAIPDAPPTDQRGFARIRGAAVDLGAVESGQTAAEIPALSQVGLVLLTALLVAAGWWRLRPVCAR